MSIVRGIPAKTTSNRFLLKFFSVALALILAFITFVFISLFSTLKSQATDQAYVTEQENIKNVTYSATLMEDTASTLLSQFYNSAKIQQLVYNASPNQLEVVSAMHMFADLVTSSSWIDSAYIYNTREDIVLFTYFREGEHRLSFSAFDDFWDKPILDLLQNSPRKTEMPQLRSIVIPNTSVPRKVFTYFLPVQSSAQSFDGFFVVNVNAEQLFELCYGITGQRSREFILVDRESNYYSNNANLIDSDGYQELFNLIFSSDSTNGFCTLDGANEKVFCVWNTVSDFPYTFISCVPEASILGHVRPLSIIVILFYLIVSVSISCSVWILSRRTNREYSNLQKLYNKATKEYQDTHNFIKDILLRNFFTAQKDHALSTKRFAENEINLEKYSHYSLILLEIQTGASPLSKESNKLQHPRVILEGLLANSVATMCRYEIVDMLKNRHLLVLDTNKPDTVQLALSKISSQLQKNYCYHYYGLYSIGVPSIDALPSEYQSLSEQFGLLFFFPKEAFVNSRSLSTKKQVGFESAKIVCKKIIQELKAQHFDQACTIISCFFDEWYEPVDSIQKTVNLLINELSNYIDAFVQLYAVTMDFDIRSYLAQVNRCDTSAEVEAVFLNLIDDMRSVLSGVGQRSNYVDQVVELIHNNCSNAAFCIDDIANQIGVSTSHIQSVFKASTGISIATYLRQHRLNNAANLLANTSMSINEIAEQTGFGNANYFYTVFKKHYSITPREYRSVQKPNQSVDS